MKHIHKFDSEQDYQNKLRLGKEGGFNGPNISLVKENKTVYYGPALFGPLVFEATDENNICSLNLGAVQHLYVDGELVVDNTDKLGTTVFKVGDGNDNNFYPSYTPKYMVQYLLEFEEPYSDGYSLEAKYLYRGEMSSLSLTGPVGDSDKVIKIDERTLDITPLVKYFMSEHVNVPVAIRAVNENWVIVPTTNKVIGVNFTETTKTITVTPDGITCLYDSQFFKRYHITPNFNVHDIAENSDIEISLQNGGTITDEHILLFWYEEINSEVTVLSSWPVSDISSFVTRTDNKLIVHTNLLEGVSLNCAKITFCICKPNTDVQMTVGNPYGDFTAETAAILQENILPTNVTAYARVYDYIDTYRFPTNGKHIVKYDLFNPSPYTHPNFDYSCVTSMNPRQIEKIYKGVPRIAESLNSIRFTKQSGELFYENCQNISDGLFDSLMTISIDPDMANEEYHTDENGTMLLWGNTLNKATNRITTIPETVTRIDSEAFRNLKYLKNFTMPEHINEIPTFTNCASLENVYYGDNVDSCYYDGIFISCDSVKEFTIPRNMTSWSKEIKDCKNFEKLTVNENLRSCYDGLVENCPSFKYIVVDPNNTTFDSRDNCNALIETSSNELKCGTILTRIPETVTSIGEYAFKGIAFPSIVIPDSVTNIGREAFYSCVNLTSVTIGTGLSSMDSRVFSGCKNLTNVSINSNMLDEIPIDAFSNCLSLTNFIIPDSVREIRMNAFTNCINLREVTLGTGLTYFDPTAFQNCPSLNNFIVKEGNNHFRFENGALFNSDYTSVDKVIGSNVILPEGLEYINSWAFEGNTKISSVNIPETVYSIGTSAFQNCTSLSSITIPDSVTTLGNVAFEGCKNLQSVTIGTGVTEIDMETFCRCTSLTGITLPESIRYISSSAFEGCSSLTHIQIPDSVTGVYEQAFKGCISATALTIGENVNHIGNSCFDGCRSLESVTLPHNLSEVHADAFANCTNLNHVAIGGSVTLNAGAFANDVNLTNITINGYVNRVNDNTFQNCSNLNTITIGPNATSVNPEFFKVFKTIPSVVVVPANSVLNDGNGSNVVIETNTGKLLFASVNTTLPNTVTSIGTHAFIEEKTQKPYTVNLSNSITSLDNYAFERCIYLTGITIPSSVEYIGDHAFTYDTSLSTVTLNSGLTSIGMNAFENCRVLENIIIPSTVTNIGSHTFASCTQLTNAVIEANITKIPYGMFEYCENLTSVTLPGTLTELDGSCFSSCSALTGVTLTDNITRIGSYAFSHCSQLQDIHIPTGLTAISDNICSYCTSLTEVVIPDIVETIGGWAFNSCENITKITLGANVKTIGNYAFSSNGNLQTIIVKAYNAPVINKNVFSGVNNPVTVYYPYGSDYSTWMEMFPNWTFVTDITPTECLELSITADDVNGNSTSTTIHWTATVRGVNIFTNETVVKTVSGTDTSETFPQNTSETNTVERTVSYTLLGVTATATFTHGVFVPAYYIVDLNGQWRKSTAISNPNSNLYDGVYESFSNINKNNSTAYAYVDINGYEEFTMYIRSNGEDDYDYMLVSQLDIPSITLSDRTNTTKVKAHTRGNPNAGTDLNSYTKVTWTGIDQGPHRICILYGKDGSSHDGTDQGYFFIPKA